MVVREKNAELAKWNTVSNFEQNNIAPVTIALFTDTDLAKRARKIALAAQLSEEQLQYFMKNLPAEFVYWTTGQWLPSSQCWFGCRNLVPAPDRPGNQLLTLSLDLTNQKANEVLILKTDSAQELWGTVGYTDEKLEPSYRLPVDEIIER